MKWFASVPWLLLVIPQILLVGEVIEIVALPLIG
jgi:hypothetical protein